MRLALFALARPTFDVDLAAATAGAAEASLRRTAAEVVGDATLLMDVASFERRLAEVRQTPVAGVVVLQASFCDAGMIKRIADTFDEAIALWAFPEPRTGGRLRLNAFCGLNLAAHALARRGRPCPYLYAAPDETPDLETLFAAAPAPVARMVTVDPAPVDAARAVEALAGAYGLIGEHPPGFDTCDFDAEMLRERFRVEVVPSTLRQLFDHARGQAPERIAGLRAETAETLAGLEALDAVAVDKSLRTYAAMRDTVARDGLNGLAVRCWPETFEEYGCAVCGAMARLGEEATPASCEADILGTLGTRLLQELAGSPAMLADIVDMDASSDTTVLWHCGLAPLSMRDPDTPAEATVHANRRKPLLNQFALKPGRVTVARLSQAMPELTLVIGRGVMVQAPRPFAGTAGTVKLDGGTKAWRDRLIGAGIEHHVSFVYGDVKDGLLSVAAKLGLPVIDLDDAA